MFERVLAGGATTDDVLADLIDFHTAHPGITEATIGACRTGSGHTGYDILAEQLEPTHLAVADLGCGNGPLLERLAAIPTLTRIVGVDACAAELGRLRVHDPRIELLASLPGRPAARDDEQPAAQLDAVLSHHAFYLMRPAEDMVEALAQAIRPGGLFAWISTSIRGGEHPIYIEMMTTMSGMVADKVPPFAGWGDRRQWTPAGREALFAGPAWEPLQTKEFVLILHEPPERLIQRVMDFFYSAWLVDREALRRAWLPLLPPDEHGNATLEWPWACILARRTES